MNQLEIKQDLSFQTWEWVMEAIGGVLIALFVTFAIAGFFGRSPRTLKTLGEKTGPLWVRYESVARWQTRSVLEVQALAASKGQVALSINNDYLDDMWLQQITPDPDSTISDSDKTTFVFPAKDRTFPLFIRFYLEPNRPGKKEAEIELIGRDAVYYQQYVLP